MKQKPQRKIKRIENHSDKQKAIYLRRRFRYVPYTHFREPDPAILGILSFAEKPIQLTINETVKNIIDLDIQLRTDCIQRTLFFRACIQAYLERDPDFVEFFDHYIKGKTRHHKIRDEKILAKEEKHYEELSKSYDFEKQTVYNGETIFDLIAGEFDFDDLEKLYQEMGQDDDEEDLEEFDDDE